MKNAWEKLNDSLRQWDEASHYKVMSVCWLTTVVSSFFGSHLLSFEVPAIGQVFLFRILLPVTVLLYLLWVIRGKDPFWKESTALEKWTYVFIAVMLVYGAISLAWAVDFMWSFRKLFNLCFDMCFFFLALRLCRQEKMRQYTLYVCAAGVVFLCVLGIYEVFFGGIFNDYYDKYKQFELFGGVYQFPVVTSTNTNDFSLNLCFFCALLLMARERSTDIVGTWKYFPMALLPAAYFLTMAASSRLILLAYWILFATFCSCTWIARRRSAWICLVILVLVMGVHFANRYEDITRSAEKYITEMRVGNNSAVKTSGMAGPIAEGSHYQVALCGTGQMMEGTARKLTASKLDEGISFKMQRLSLKDEFFYTDNETGKLEVRKDNSGGIRLQLLLHAANCLVDSYGLGVGLGNTESLAPNGTDIPRWASSSQYSIHCFIARIIGDYGLFALIPLCAIAFLLLSKIWKLFLSGWRTKDKNMIGQAIMFFGCILIYPFVSTASSDAQDNISMWMYLAMVVLLATELCDAGLDETK